MKYRLSSRLRCESLDLLGHDREVLACVAVTFAQVGVERKWLPFGKTNVYGEWRDDDTGSNLSQTIIINGATAAIRDAEMTSMGASATLPDAGRNSTISTW